MKVLVNITLQDQTSREKLAAQGVTSEQLLELYTEGFKTLLDDVITIGTKVDLHVAVMDNTKEDQP